LHEINLENKQLMNSYDLADGAICPGTHAIGYSDVNKHLYIECLAGGILEWDTQGNKMVEQVVCCSKFACAHAACFHLCVREEGKEAVNGEQRPIAAISAMI
jgi:hypothetical protein